MRNIILDTLPETVEVDGREFFIDTDFRTCIIFEKVLMSKDSEADLLQNVLTLFYPEGAPQDTEKAIEKIVELYRCGGTEKSVAGKKNGDVSIKPKLIYDYEYDAPYIYAAFLSQYGIDLNEIEYLHWWKFQALFRGLESHTKIVEIMGYRAADIGKIKNKHERERMAKLQRLYAIPQSFTVEEKVAMAGAAFAF